MADKIYRIRCQCKDTVIWDGRCLNCGLIHPDSDIPDFVWRAFEETEPICYICKGMVHGPHIIDYKKGEWNFRQT